VASNAAISGSDAVVHCGLDHRYDPPGWQYPQFAPATDQFKAFGATLIEVSHDSHAAFQ
jgi:hypothetical protein